MNPAPHPSLADIAADPAVLDAVDLGAIPKLRAELARLDSMLLMRLFGNNRNGTSERAERLLSVEQAASKLSTSRDWLYRHAEKLPFTVRLGKRLLFSEQGIDGYIRRRMGRKAVV